MTEYREYFGNARLRPEADIPRSLDQLYDLYLKRKQLKAQEAQQAQAGNLFNLQEGFAPSDVTPQTVAQARGPETMAESPAIAAMRDYIARRKGGQDLEKRKSEAELKALEGGQLYIDPQSGKEMRIPAGAKLLPPSPFAAQKPPPGFRYTPDGNLEAIPGGPATIKDEAKAEKEKAGKDAAKSQAQRLISTIDQALQKVGGTSAGIGGAVFRNIPGTTAKDLESDLETINANLGFAELQAMRQASPTGGALGAIAVQELVALQSTIASLDPKQSPEQLRERLNKVKQHYSKWLSTLDGTTEAVAPDSSGETIVPVVGPDGKERNAVVKNGKFVRFQ